MTKKQFLALAGVFVLGCALMLTATLAKKYRTKIEWNGTQYNIEKVNPVDRTFARPYNRLLDKTGDVFVGLLLLEGVVLVAIVFFTSKDKVKAFKSAFFECFTFGMCFFYANGIYRILKTLAGRIRPYMYFANPSEKGIAEHDFYRSWPSGHSANVFLAFAFILAWFNFRHSDSRFRKPVLTVSFVLCVTTMILRMLSGNHFLTDVLSGAAIGFTVSYAIAVLCNKINPLSGDLTQEK